MSENALVVFENYKIRRHYDEETETWYFSVVDILQALIQQPDYQTARKYWNKLKERLKKEGSESVTNRHQLKLESADGKKYITERMITAKSRLCLTRYYLCWCTLKHNSPHNSLNFNTRNNKLAGKGWL